METKSGVLSTPDQGKWKQFRHQKSGSEMCLKTPDMVWKCV